MKNYVYILVSETNEIVAVYESRQVAEKLLNPISVKLDKKVKIIKQLLNPDIKIVGL